MDSNQNYNIFKEYEEIYTQKLNKSPFIIRLDGRSFSNFCKRFQKPYCNRLHTALNKVCLELCKEIQDCKFAQRHSDEMSFLVILNKESDGYFGLNISKICSVLSSMASSVFTKELIKTNDLTTFDDEYPAFDARCFNLPNEDIERYFQWRITDSYKNSINSWARSFFQHNQLLDVNCDEMINMMKKENFDWEGVSPEKKYGYCFYKSTKQISKMVTFPNEERLVSYSRQFWGINPIESIDYINSKVKEIRCSV